MARKLEDLYYNLDMKNKDFMTASKQAEAQLGKMEKNAFEAGRKIGTTLRNAFLVVTAAITGAIVAITKLVNAYQDQARAELKLQNAMKNTTGANDANYKSMLKYANELQALTGVQDDVIINLMSMAKMQGIQDSQMQKVIQTTLDLSAAFGIDQSAALKAVTGAYAGNVDMLSRYVKNVKQMKEAGQSGAQIIENVSKAVGGQAKVLTDASGGAAQLNVMVGELTESVGKKLLPAFIGLVKIGMQAVDFFYSLMGAGNALEVSQRKLNEAVSNYNKLHAPEMIEKVKDMTAAELKLYDLQVKLSEIDLKKRTMEFLDMLPNVMEEIAEIEKYSKLVNESLKPENIAQHAAQNLMSVEDDMKYLLEGSIKLEKELAENQLKIQEGAINFLELMVTESGDTMMPYLQSLSDAEKEIFSSAFNDMYKFSSDMNKQVIQDALKTLETLKKAGFYEGAKAVSYGFQKGVLTEMLKSAPEEPTFGVGTGGGTGNGKAIDEIKHRWDGVDLKIIAIKNRIQNLAKSTETYGKEVKEIETDWLGILGALKGMSPEMDEIITGAQSFIDVLSSGDPLIGAIKLAIAGTISQIDRMKSQFEAIIAAMEEADRKHRENMEAAGEHINNANQALKEQRLERIRTLEIQGKQDEADKLRLKMLKEEKAEKDAIYSRVKRERDIQLEKLRIDENNSVLQREVAAQTQIMEEAKSDSLALGNDILEIELRLNEDLLDIERKRRDERMDFLRKQIELGIIDPESFRAAGYLRQQVAGLGLTGVDAASALQGLGVGREAFQRSVSIGQITQNNYEATPDLATRGMGGIARQAFGS